MRRWQSQDPRKQLSGQIAVAVITGRPVEEIIQQVGHEHHTTTRELARVLSRYGYLCPCQCIPVTKLKEVPKLGIAQVHSAHSSRWHWVAVEDGRVFDGIWGDAYGVVSWPADFRITSYLPIEE
jgi:hypothetical protein